MIIGQFTKYFHTHYVVNLPPGLCVVGMLITHPVVVSLLGGSIE